VIVHAQTVTQEIACAEELKNVSMACGLLVRIAIQSALTANANALMVRGKMLAKF
jgi:hypothetical protein